MFVHSEIAFDSELSRSLTKNWNRSSFYNALNFGKNTAIF